MAHARTTSLPAGPLRTWLVINPASGSYDDKAFEALCECCRDNAIELDRVIRFPDEDDLPSAAELDAAGIDLVTIYTGDGTINALVTGLYGWSGAVLILPGGTMNLLSIRLHGDVETDEIVARVAAGHYRKDRPGVVRCEAGDALAGLMVGPGTAWGEVREAMRNLDVVGFATQTVAAIGESTAGTMVKVVDPAIGKDEGYPLVVMTPEQGMMSVAAYHSETVGDYAQQGVALLQRDFRKGPHDDLGRMAAMTLANEEGEPLQTLIDGEPADMPSRATFTVVPCEVDLIVTGAPA
ncbi:MAG TPA: diacylglycerol kinase family protein [Croceicoccus sp.]|nr:diacylglycerol kinase family protein [Croceicoccus sp.]